MTTGQAFSLDLDTLSVNPAGQSRSYILASGTLPPGLALSGARSNILSGTPTTSGTYTPSFGLLGGPVASVIFDVASGGQVTALQDWINRSTAAGVVQAIRFNNATNVTANTHNDGLQSHVTRDTTDGIIGDGCLKIDVLPTDDTGSGQWRVPLSSAFTQQTHGMGSAAFFVNYRLKLGPNRLLPTVNGGGFKTSIVSGGNFASPNSGYSNTANELVINNYLYRGFPQAYYYHPIGAQTPFNTNDAQGRLHLQDAIDNGAGISDPNLRYCLYPVTNPNGCFKFTEQQWLNVKQRIKVVDFGGPGIGNEYDLWVADDGAAAWTLLMSERDFRVGTDTETPNGYNWIWLLPYDSGRTSASYATWHKYDQLIVSMLDIPIPQAPATPPSSAPVWFSSTGSKTWVAPMNNAAAIAANRHWVGASAVIDPLANTTNRGSCGSVSSIYDGYCGIAPNRQNGQAATFAQGGHCNYYGNEFNHFNLRDANPMWTRRRNATAAHTLTGNLVTWSDGRPTSSHGYQTCLGAENRFFGFGRSGYNFEGGSANDLIFEYLLATEDYINRGSILAPNVYPGNQCVMYDPVLSRAIVINGAGTNSFGIGSRMVRLSDMAVTQSVSANFEDGGELVGAIDQTNRIIVVRGNQGYWWSKLPGLASWAPLTVGGVALLDKHGFDWHSPSGGFLTYKFGSGVMKGVPTVNGAGNYTGMTWSVVPGFGGLTPPDYNRAGGAGLYNRFWIADDMGDGRPALVYHPGYAFPDVYVAPIPATGV